MEYVRKGDLKSPTKFKERYSGYISRLQEYVETNYDYLLSSTVIGDLILSACRCNENDVLTLIAKKYYINEDSMMDWVDNRLIPNYVELHPADPEVLKLLIFSLQITYQMFGGGSRATTTAKGFRTRNRGFETIVVDQFVGKLGEIVTKKFFSKQLKTDIQLDWEISTKIKKYRNDIANAEKLVSIKTTPNLRGVWAEADIGYDYGIMAKCHVPQAPFLMFLNQSGGYRELLNFASKGISKDDDLFTSYIEEIKNEIEAEEQDSYLSLGGYMLGFFNTDDYKPTKVGKILEYLGDVRESRHLVRIDNLKYDTKDWLIMIKQAGIK